MYGAVTSKAQAGEVLAGIVPRVLIDVVKMHSYVDIAFATGGAAAIVMAPSSKSSLAVTFKNRLSSLSSILDAIIWRATAFNTLAAHLVTFGSLYAVSLAEIARKAAARFSAFRAKSVPQAISATVLHAVPVPFKARSAHGLAHVDVRLSASDTLAEPLADDLTGSVLVDPQVSGDLSRIPGFLVASHYGIGVNLCPSHRNNAPGRCGVMFTSPIVEA